MMDKLQQSFLDTYNKESDSVFRYSLFRVSDKEVALDLTQEVFMRYWDQMIKGVKIKNHKAYIFTILNRLIIDWYRKKKPVSLEAYSEKFEEGEFDLSNDISSNQIEMEADSKELLNKINELDPLYKQAIYLRYVEDLKPHEIGDILEVSSNVISVRISRGLDLLRKISRYDLNQ